MTNNNHSTSAETTYVDPNPIKHLSEGWKNFLKLNLVTTILLTLLSAAGFIALFVYAKSYYDRYYPSIASGEISNTLGWEGARPILINMAVAFVLFIIFQSLISASFSRLFLENARGRTVKLTDALSFGLSRLPMIWLTWILVTIVSLAVIAIPFALGVVIHPVVGILFILPLIICAVVVWFFLYQIRFVLVENTSPANPVDALRKSYDTTRRSLLAVLIYVLLLFGVSSFFNTIQSFMPPVDNGVLSQIEKDSQQSKKFVWPEKDELDKSIRMLVIFISVSSLPGVAAELLAALGLSVIYDKTNPSGRDRRLPKQG